MTVLTLTTKTDDQITLDWITRNAHSGVLQSALLTITPELAGLLLAGQQRNRKINRAQVKRLVSELQRGAWRITGAGLQFDQQGRLLDGQHRLTAIAQAGLAVRMYVTVGNPEHAVFDDGVGRTLRQQIHIAGGASWEVKAVEVVGCLAQVFGRGALPKSKEFFDASAAVIGREHLQAVAEATSNRYSAPVRAALVYARPVHPEAVDFLIECLKSGQVVVSDAEAARLGWTPNPNRNVTLQTLFTTVSVRIPNGGRGDVRKDHFLRVLNGVRAFLDGAKLTKLIASDVTLAAIGRQREALGLAARALVSA